LIAQGSAESQLWPLHVAVVGCERVTELIFRAAKACIDAQRAGESTPTHTVHPRFADELLEPLPASARAQSA